MTTTTRDNYCVTAPGIAEGTDANTFKTTYATTAVVDGRTVYKAATDSIAFAAYTGTTTTALAAKETCAYFHMLKGSDGSLSQLQSAIVPSTLGTSYKPGAWEWPADRAGYACIGATVVRTDGSATFTAGSTDLGASDVVDTHYNASPGVYGTPITY